MPVSGLIPCAGLITDPSPLITGAQGALRTADDIVIERPGAASQRPGFGLHASRSINPRPRSMHLWAPSGTVVAYAASLTGSTWSMESESSTITGTAEPIASQESFPQFMEARKNLYWCAKDGPYKITGAADTAGELAGMHEATSGQVGALATGTPAVFATDRAWAYRWCFVKTDANGNVIRSAPSPWQSVENTSGSLRDGFAEMALPTYVAANDVIELYRTKVVSPATATPSDMMYLVKRYRVTSSDVTNAWAQIEDRVLESKLGAELYTNPTREGDDWENGRPPASRAIALFAECAWFGGTIGPWTAIFDFMSVSGGSRAAGTFGYRNLTCATTLDSFTVTMASTANLTAGMLVTDGSAPGTSTGTISIGTTIASVDNATDITLSAKAAATNAAISLRFHDSITIDGQAYYAHSTTLTAVGRGATDYPYFATTGTTGQTARNLAAVVTMDSATVFGIAIEDPAGIRDRYGYPTRPASVVIRGVSLSMTSLAITTTNLTAFDFQPDSSGAITVARDDKKNWLFYSKPGEPEHVPELSYMPVGSELEPIFALVPLRAALLVFKRDGVFRVTGSAPDNWRVDLLDGSIRLLRAECVTEMGGSVYAWTDTGVVELGEGAPRSISEGKIGRELEILARLQRADPATTGVFVTSWRRKNLVIVGAPFGAGDVAATYLYAFNTVTRAWSRWTHSAFCAAESQVDGNLYLTRSGGFFEIRKGNDTTSTFFGHDRSYSLSTWTYTAGSTTVSVADADRGAWTPKAGDTIYATISGTVYYRRVDAAVDAGTSYDLTIDEAFPAGAQSSRVGVEGIISKIRWQTFHVGTPAVGFLARETQVSLDWSAAALSIGGATSRMLVGASTDESSSTTTIEANVTRAAKTIQVRATVPLECARAEHLYPYFETDDIGLEWRCLGYELVYEGTSEKGRRT